jgi:hypothetical protein
MECPKCKKTTNFQGERSVASKVYQVHLCLNPECTTYAIRTTLDLVTPEWKHNAVRILKPSNVRKSG